MIETKTCKGCQNSFVPAASNHKYCSEACRPSYKKTFEGSPLFCKKCENSFVPNQPNQKYCSKECCDSFHQEKKKLVSERNCIICKKKYMPKSGNQKYCSKECYIEHQIKLGMKTKLTEKQCKFCNKVFMPRVRMQVFCTSKCLHKSYDKNLTTEQMQKQRIRSQKTREKQKAQQEMKNETNTKVSYVNFGELHFFTEKQFEKWFEDNYVLFGLKRLIKINRMFPDVIAETYDGKVLRIELEFNASNFSMHKHDPSGCDLIISYISLYGKNNISGVPVISIFNATFLLKGINDYNPKTLQLSNYFQVMVENCNKMLNDFMLSNKAYNSEKQEIYQRSVGHTYLKDTLKEPQNES